MAKQLSSPNSAASALSKSRPFAAALLGLSIAWIAFAPIQSALGAPPTKTPVQEESVLVATHEPTGTITSTSGTAPVDELEPTAQSSDFAPEVASGTENSADPG